MPCQFLPNLIQHWPYCNALARFSVQGNVTKVWLCHLKMSPICQKCHLGNRITALYNHYPKQWQDHVPFVWKTRPSVMNSICNASLTWLLITLIKSIINSAANRDRSSRTIVYLIVLKDCFVIIKKNVATKACYTAEHSLCSLSLLK